VRPKTEVHEEPAHAPSSNGSNAPPALVPASVPALGISGPPNGAAASAKNYSIERSLEDLLLDSPPVRPLEGSSFSFNAGVGAASSLSGGFPPGFLNGPPPPHLLPPPPGGLFPPPHHPGFGMPPPSGAPGQYGAPPQHLPPHLQGFGLPGPGGPPPHLPPPQGRPGLPPPSPFGPYFGGNNAGPQAPPPSTHLQPPQLPPGRYGQSYQTMFAAPPQAPPTHYQPQDSSFRGFSVHDMLNRATSGGAQQHAGPAVPLSPSAEDRSRQLKELLSLQPSQQSNHGAAAPQSGAGYAFAAPISSPTGNAVGAEHAQKSRALLSLLKSSKAGPTLTGAQAPPAGHHAPASTAPHPHPAMHMSPKHGAPLTPSAQQHAAASVPAPPSAVGGSPFTTPVKGKPRSLTATDLEEGISNTNGAVNATPAKKASFFRNTRFQTGLLYISLGGEVRKHHVMRPSANMLVHWQLPEADFHALMNRPRVVLVIGLVRYGSYTNSPCFVSKPIESRPKLIRDKDGHGYYQGSVPFHAPKSAGQFVYRMFDETTKETILTTLASSSVFTVDLVDFHVNTNLRHILEALNEKSKLKGIAQMPTVLRGIRNSGRNDRGGADRADSMLNEALVIVLKAAEDASEVLQAWQTRRKQEEEMKARSEEFTTTLSKLMLLFHLSGTTETNDLIHHILCVYRCS
jgi:hypothetical protein